MSYAPAVYVASAIAFQMWQSLQDDRVEYFSYPQTEEQVCEWFERSFNGRIDQEEAAAVIGVLDAVGLIAFDEDPFAGRFLKANARGFSKRWQDLARSSGESPFGKAAEFGMPWLKAVFDNQAFWASLHETDPSRAPFLLPGDMLRAPEPVVFIIEGSVEGVELRSGLDTLAEELRTNNAIASDLGEDRTRIVAEVSASRDLIQGGAVRVGAVREVLVKVLREILRKLKEKAVDLGVERLLDLALKLIGS